MRFPYSVPNVTVIKNNEPVRTIETMQYLDEQDDRVYLRCAETVKEFVRGLTCDLNCHYLTFDQNRENEETDSFDIKDLVLVHINKTFDINGVPEFEYVFFK
ncbi:hypothetical protein [uncultured Metabacillus sp.]|uniref:hypothetical protein n=1 Tax=uncultured Metabacillus sp. TaxID=2860135 RepID=UPI0026212B08|nr:hypothetical protein [uncultured Metabacillus sp.]